MAGWPRFRNLATSAFRYSNCAFRSGCEAPSRVLRLPCKLYPAWSSKVATVPWLTGCACRVNSSASVRLLLIVQRSGDSGSPRDVGSTRPSSAGNNCGSFRMARRRPPPVLRIRSGGNAAFSRRGVFNSAIPARTVVCDTRVASATAVTPPQPISRASLAAHNRRDRSLSAPRSCRNFRRILAMTCASCIPKSSQNPSIGTIANSPSYFFTSP